MGKDNETVSGKYYISNLKIILTTESVTIITKMIQIRYS